MNLTQRIVTAMLLGLICGALLNAIFSFDLLPQAVVASLLQLPVEVNQKKIWHLTVPHI